MQLKPFPGQPANRNRKSPATKQAVITILAALALSLSASAQVGGAYKVTNIISDGSVPAAFTDASFINPWGISASPTWWINTQGTGLSYVVASTPTAGTINFKVVVPASSGLTTATGLPAGVVTTSGTTGMILPNATKASFLFSTLDGTISGWNSKLGTAGAISQIAINNTAAGASYPGLAVINTTTASYILAPNFGTGNAIEIYDGNFAKTTLPGTFKDPSLPANYAPFSVHVIGTKVYVAYALRTTTAPFRSVDALGNGAVSVFDTSGNFIARVATGGNLDSPWGVAIAPANFGIFGGNILIGNFGNGLINAYDATTFAYRGQLTDGTGKPLTFASLWDLLPGGTTVGNSTAVSGGDPNTVYLSAGLAGETHGLFAAISNDTTTGTPNYGLSAAAGSVTVAAGSSATTTIAIAPTFSFNGTVTLACSGLPVSATCSFSPSTVPVSATTSTTSTVTFTTTKATAALQPHRFGSATGITLALLLPCGCLFAFRRRYPGSSNPLRLLIAVVVCFAPLLLVAGCSSSSSQPPPTPTPAGTSNITITATSGAITQTTTMQLIVQ